jgi:hypothetical protein
MFWSQVFKEVIFFFKKKYDIGKVDVFLKSFEVRFKTDIGDLENNATLLGK